MLSGLSISLGTMLGAPLRATPAAALGMPLVAAMGNALAAADAAVPLPTPTPTLERYSGVAPPALKLTDTKGNDVDFAQFRGKVVVLNFWATWCAPCLEEMPSLERLHQSLASRQALVLGVSVGDARMSVERFVEANRISFPILMDADKSQFKRWKVGILPTTFVLDANGAPRFWHVGERAWDEPIILATIDGLLASRAKRAAR